MSIIFNRTNLKTFRDKLDKLLKEFSEENGVKASVGNFTFSDTEFRTQLTVASSNNPEEIEKNKFAKECFLFGLKEEDYGRSFETYNGKYKITGFKPRSTKYPIIGTCLSTGKSYKFPDSILTKLK